MTYLIGAFVLGVIFLLLANTLSDGLGSVVFSVFYVLGLLGSFGGAAGIVITLIVRSAD